MKRYVVTFLFDRQFNVWLIEKQKPEWQKDCLNGIGGKIEPNENSLDAAVRELKEEAGVTIPKEDLYEVGFMWGTNNDGSNFEVYIFTGITDETLSTQEEEKILKMPMNQVQFEKRIDNVPMLLHACHYRLTGKSNFSKLIMEYKAGAERIWKEHYLPLNKAYDSQTKILENVQKHNHELSAQIKKLQEENERLRR